MRPSHLSWDAEAAEVGLIVLLVMPPGGHIDETGRSSGHRP